MGKVLPAVLPYASTPQAAHEHCLGFLRRRKKKSMQVELIEKLKEPGVAK